MSKFCRLFCLGVSTSENFSSSEHMQNLMEAGGLTHDVKACFRASCGMSESVFLQARLFQLTRMQAPESGWDVVKHQFKDCAHK